MIITSMLLRQNLNKATFNRSRIAFGATKSSSMNLVTRSSAIPRLVVPWKSRSISQHRQNSTNLSVVNSLRYHWSNLVQNFRHEWVQLKADIAAAAAAADIKIKNSAMEKQLKPPKNQNSTVEKQLKPRTNQNSAVIKETPTLNQFGTNMNDLARKGKYDPFASRQSEIKRVIMILSRRRKNNPCLIGEPGVGKTAIIEGLAQRIVQGDVPLFLQGKRIVSIDMGLVIAGLVNVGVLEGRMMNLIREAKEAKDVILFFDELHTMIGAGRYRGNHNDAAQTLKPALARGELQCIGATTTDEYKKYIEKDKALERRFQPVKVLEPSVEETVEILKGLQKSYEEHHLVRFTDEALVAAAKLSHQYINERFLPDKAIDLIDEAAASVRQETNSAEVQEVTEHDVGEALSCWTGIPSEKLTVNESDRLLRLEDTLHASVVGQNEAVAAISRAIRRARSGLRNPHRPVATLIFSGPTGVGKTELAKALAASYYGSDKAMIRLDMSEYMERHSVSRLIGSPPGYYNHEDGGQLTDAVRRRPHSLVLFDELEKAHSDVFNIMLQIMDDGRLTDGKGRTVDFKNTMIIMTSNVGSHAIENGTDHDMRSRVIEELQKAFRPEFLNRVDEMVVFQQLAEAEVEQIADMMLEDVRKRMMEKKKIAGMHVTEKFKQKVMEEGYDRRYGARALRRAITRLLEDNLADNMLAGEIREGDFVKVDVDDGGNVVINAGPIKKYNLFSFL